MVLSPPQRRPKPQPALAAIDLGSNSFRLEIAHIDGGQYRRLDYLKETVRLGGGLTPEGLLTEEAIQRGLACLDRFASRLRECAAVNVRAVATQTLREARNRNVFLERAQQVLGHPVEVISGREEARLIFAGVARLQPSGVPRLVIDIGGRSTEMILGRRFTARKAESFSIGSVSLSMRYFADGHLSADAFRQAQIAAGAELEEALVPFAPAQWREALGSSGTVGALSQLLIAEGITDGTITPASLQWVIQKCLAAGHIDKLNFAGLKDERRTVIAAGVCILYTLATQFHITALHPAKGALRQGVIFDLHERQVHAAHPTQGHDVRDETVHDLQTRFGVDVPHAARVCLQATHLYDDLLGGGRVNSAQLDGRQTLQWAALMHEMGMMISHHDHHRHSAYVMTHVDAPGFSQSQQRQLGLLLLGQRGGLRKLEAELADVCTARQVLCLRLAVIMCHARSPVPAKAWHLRCKGPSMAVSLSYSHHWARRNPRTVHLLTEEVALWARVASFKLQLCPA